MRGQFMSTIVGGVIGGCVVLALQGGLAKAQSANAAGTIEAKELNVVDSKGKIRISMRCDSNDAPRIRLLDANGAMRCALGLGNQDRHENPFFYLIDDTGVKADLSIAEDGAPVFFLNGRDGKPRIFMCSSPAETGEISQLIVYGNSKGLRTEIISNDGKTGVSTYQHGALRTYSGIMPEGLAGLMVNDQDGRPGTVVGVTADDRRVMARLKKGSSMEFTHPTKSRTGKNNINVAKRRLESGAPLVAPVAPILPGSQGSPGEPVNLSAPGTAAEPAPTSPSP